MNSYFIYSIESGICLAVFYLVFLLMFRMDTFFAISRIYILCTLIASAVIPVLNFSSAVGNSDVIPTAMFSTITVEANRVESVVNTNVGFTEIILAIYLTGVLIFLSRFIMRLFILFRLVRRNSINKVDGYKIVFTEEKYSPFSFFNIIFLSNSFVYNSETELILAHEKVHIDKHHTFDILLTEMITILQWFNPFVWFYKKSLQEVHEYQADEGVVKIGCDKIDYQKLILSKIADSEIFQTANNFNYSLIKRRIIMISKNKTKRLALVKLILVLPISLILFLSFSCSQKENGINNDNLKGIKTDSEKKGIDINYEFPGGFNEMVKYLAKNIKYPEDARKKGVEGTVVVVFNVQKDGSLTDVKIEKGIGSGCDEEAIRVIKLMPKWERKSQTVQNSQEVKLPIAFRLSKEKSQSENKTQSSKNNESKSNDFVVLEKPQHDFVEIDMDALVKAIKYPEEARKKGIEGTVNLKVLFKKTGEVGNILVEKTDNKIFNEAAMNAVKTLKFTPAMNDGKKIDMWMSLPIKFKLK